MRSLHSRVKLIGEINRVMKSFIKIIAGVAVLALVVYLILPGPSSHDRRGEAIDNAGYSSAFYRLEHP